MSIQISKLGIKLLVIYLILASIAFLIYFIFRDEDALAGLYVLFVTSPWSYISVLFLLNKFYPDLPSLLLDSLLFFYICLNSVILYFVGSRLDKSKKEKGNGSK